jgi:hypothetical protein
MHVSWTLPRNPLRKSGTRKHIIHHVNHRLLCLAMNNASPNLCAYVFNARSLASANPPQQQQKTQQTQQQQQPRLTHEQARTMRMASLAAAREGRYAQFSGRLLALALLRTSSAVAHTHTQSLTCCHQQAAESAEANPWLGAGCRGFGTGRQRRSRWRLCSPTYALAHCARVHVGSERASEIVQGDLSSDGRLCVPQRQRNGRARRGKERARCGSTWPLSVRRASAIRPVLPRSGDALPC